MRPRPRLRWLYRPGALPAVEYGEFSDCGNKGPGRRSSSGHHTAGIRRPQDAGWLGGSADQLRTGRHSVGQPRACRRKEAGMPRTRRIVAGVSASPGNLPALRQAADLARAYDATLTFVHAWLPSGPEFAAWQFPSGPLV